jgi:transcriptional regulator with XRE-family HTH domain
MGDVDNLKTAIGARIKQARGALGLTQKGLCEATGMPFPSLRNYESSNQIPGGEAILALMHAGINANWLLTGEGPMRIEDLAGAETPGALDRERMRLAMEAIEEGLSEVRLTMAPPKKAELLLAAYDLLETDGVTKEKVMKIVKLAA